MKASKLEIIVLAGLIGISAALTVFHEKVIDFVYQIEKNYIGKVYK